MLWIEGIQQKCMWDEWMKELMDFPPGCSLPYPIPHCLALTPFSFPSLRVSWLNLGQATFPQMQPRPPQGNQKSSIMQHSTLMRRSLGALKKRWPLVLSTQRSGFTVRECWDPALAWGILAPKGQRKSQGLIPVELEALQGMSCEYPQKQYKLWKQRILSAKLYVAPSLTNQSLPCCVCFLLCEIGMRSLPVRSWWNIYIKMVRDLE